MTRRHKPRRWPIVATIVVALGLSVVPLPATLQFGRPDWLALVICYFVLHRPRQVGVGSAWLSGLALDTLTGTLLGQHALALAVIAFVTDKFRLRIRVFPIWQQAATVFSLVTIYRFILFWINGVAGVPVPGSVHWVPVIIDAALWPLLVPLLRRIEQRIDT